MRTLLALGTLFALLPGQAFAQETKGKPVAAPQAPPLTDAPHQFHQEDGSITAKWVADGKVVEDDEMPLNIAFN